MTFENFGYNRCKNENFDEIHRMFSKNVPIILKLSKNKNYFKKIKK